MGTGNPEFAVYDLDQVTCSFAGLIINSGFGEGGAIKLEQQDPDFVNKVGSDGTVARSKTNKRLTKVTITLLQTAKANAALSTLNNVDRAASNGAGVAPILIRDRQGLSVFAGGEAWIEGPPQSVEYGTEATDREWVLWVARPERFDGGN
jgi:hypothetical protein